MRTGTKVAIGVGGAALVGGGVYYWKYYRVPNRPGYTKLLLGKSEWGASACQVLNWQTVAAGVTALKNYTGTVYLALGAALARDGKPFVSSGSKDSGSPMYAIAKISRSSTSSAWTLQQRYLVSTTNQAGSFTGGVKAA